MKSTEKDKLIYEVYFIGKVNEELAKKEHREQVELIKQTIKTVFETDEPKSAPKEQYTITTYENMVTEGYGSIKNLIEVHVNNNNSFKTKIFNINEDEFYSKYNTIDNYDDMIRFSKVFIKYIANNKINSKLGIAKVVEFCRCEENIDNILLSFGYNIKSKIVKTFSLYKYKNYPIYLIPSYIFLSETQKFDIYELFGFCLSTEEEKLYEKISEIKDSLSKVLSFV